jgi:hypothetical protein
VGKVEPGRRLHEGGTRRAERAPANSLQPFQSCIVTLRRSDVPFAAVGSYTQTQECIVGRLSHAHLQDVLTYTITVIEELDPFRVTHFRLHLSPAHDDV